jgi:hypothetical protein
VWVVAPFHLDEGEGQQQRPDAEEALRVVRVDERDGRALEALARHQGGLPTDRERVSVSLCQRQSLCQSESQSLSLALSLDRRWRPSHVTREACRLRSPLSLRRNSLSAVKSLSLSVSLSLFLSVCLCLSLSLSLSLSVSLCLSLSLSFSL